MLFSYIVGNGDLRLKNLSIVEQSEGTFALSRAYVLVSTGIYGDRELALPVQGKKTNVTRRNWLTFAEEHASIPRADAIELPDEVLTYLAGARGMIEESMVLDEHLRTQYLVLVNQRLAALTPSRSDAEE